MTPVGYDRVLALMLRTARGRAAVSQVSSTLDVNEQQAAELFAEMVRRGHAQHLPGVWGGEWYELTERGTVAAAWVVCRDHVGLDGNAVTCGNAALGLVTTGEAP